MIRVGHGFDIHRFNPSDGESAEQHVVLCGIAVSHHRSICAHSDGDVAVHALIDALLGALALGDIGQHFPDTDSQYKNADSLRLLTAVAEMIAGKGWDIGNIDLTIIAERPKLAPYILPMRQRLSEVLAIQLDQVSVKATTHEKQDSIGAGDAIAVHCVCALTKF